MRYYRLLAPKDKGTIVRTEGRIQHQFVPGSGWVRSGIMLDYFWPDSDTFERYEEITEEAALEVISHQ